MYRRQAKLSPILGVKEQKNTRITLSKTVSALDIRTFSHFLSAFPDEIAESIACAVAQYSLDYANSLQHGTSRHNTEITISAECVGQGCSWKDCSQRSVPSEGLEVTTLAASGILNTCKNCETSSLMSLRSCPLLIFSSLVKHSCSNQITSLV